MTVDLFLRVYPKDYDWARYCLRSIQRFATGFRRVVVVTPFGEKPPIGSMEDHFEVAEFGTGYMEQQLTKLNADAYTDAEFITFIDADTIFTRPVSPDLLIHNQRHPIWLYTPYTSINSGDGQTWKAPTEKLMKRPVELEMMRRHPFTVPRWALVSFRQWVQRNHGMSLERYIMSQPGHEFSEFNAIGMYLWLFHKDRIKWQNTDEDIGTCFVHQHYSYGGINDDTRKNMEAALA